MSRVSFWSPTLVLAAGAIAISPGIGALDQSAPVVAPAASGHVISLASLGYREGIAFSGLDGREDLFFRVPSGSWLAGMRLHLPYEAVAASPAQRTLTLLVGDRVIGQAAINGSGVIDLPVPADAVDNGALHLTLDYSGGVSASRCLDRRVSADHLRLDPAGGAILDIAPAAVVPVADAVQLIGHDPAIVLPAQIDTASAAAALTVVAGRGGGRLIGASAQPGEDHVQLAGPASPSLATRQAGGATVLAIGGRDPTAAARAAFSSARMLLSSPVVDRLSVSPKSAETLTLGDLGANLAPVSVAETGEWSVALPASRLPAGKTVAAIDIDIAAVPVTGRDSVSAWFNETLLASAPLDRSGRTRLEATVPDGLMHSLNGIAVKIDRGDRNDCGDVPRGWPAQLLPSSEVRLRGAGAGGDFHDFAAASHDGVTVVMPGPQALPLAAKVVAGLIDGSVPIAVAWQKMPDRGPVILISDTPPPGAQMPLQMAGGRLVLAGADGGATFDVPAARDLTVAQITSVDGRQVLWVRPAQGVVPASMWLDRGDVALVSPSGALTPFSSLRPRLDPIVEPERPIAWWQHYRGPLIGAAILLLLIAAWSFGPSMRRPKPG